ncbi:MAG TPA: TonB-dependent receptor, partial [Longimicrobiales bacterium]
LHARDVAQQSSVSTAMNAFVPGVWAWQSPAGFTAVFTTRGASSFGVSAPKIYIDGIEVANPLLATQIAPDNIERIEVIRGPQGAALYGADALNGVTNIVTRHDAGGSGVPLLRVRSDLAVSATDFTAGSAVGQDHAASLQVGSRARSANLNFGIGSVGEYMPGGFARHVSADGSVRVVGARTMLTATARVYSQSAASPASLLLDSARYEITPLSMRQYTSGIKLLLQPNDRITHSLVVGIDGYALGNEARDTMAPLTASDSVLRAWDGGLRTTFRFATVAQLDAGRAARAALTFAFEHSGLHQHGTGSAALAYPGANGLASQHPADAMGRPELSAEAEEYLTGSALYEQSRSSNGLSAQFDAALHERLFFNGGLRVEHDFVNGAGEGTALLPLAGVSYVLGGPDLNVKLRSAYGKGVRWPEMPRLENSYQHARIVRPMLSPEQQSGIEGGVDVSYRELLGVQVTRYSQTATGLSQMVALQRPQNAPASWNGFAVQSVGEIANRGWELLAYLRRGALSLSGTMALTDSRVQQVAAGYTGDLHTGDRMLGVPARTVSVAAAWQSRDWSASFTAARAYDWVNYDRAQLAQLSEQPVGEALRSYWQPYGGFTHVRATLSRTLAHDITLLLVGDNLLDKQVGEPDNLTVVPGRTVSLGFKAAF